MTEPLIVGIGEFKIAKGEGLITSYSLGSCVGVAIYDQVAKVAGLAHIMLADSLSTTDANAMRSPFKYADIGIRMLIHDMVEMGAVKRHMAAKIAGGACMFESAVKDPIFDVGRRNIESVKKVLGEEKVALIAEDCGKNYGRTLTFDAATGKLSVKSLKSGILIL